VKVAAIVVSVDYAAELARSIDRWVAGLEQLVVVTAPRDEATIALAERSGARLHQTDVFWADGAYFAKGAAIAEAWPLFPPDGWRLLIDADVIPPENWMEVIESARPRVGTLHGARRRHEDGRPIRDGELAGFFQLWHAHDPRGREPVGRHWTHAGCYDSDFMLRWPHTQQRLLPLELVHLGEPGRNWCGRGNEDAMRAIRERRKRGKHWRTETIGSDAGRPS